jgi:hypothetical protein
LVDFIIFSHEDGMRMQFCHIGIEERGFTAGGAVLSPTKMEFARLRSSIGLIGLLMKC